MPFQYIKAQDLDHWTDRDPRRVQELLPKLIEKLILCSNIGVRTCNFPHGPAIQYPGYDGYLDCETFNAFCPAGVSVWEAGTNKAIEQKFKEDFQKRMEKPAEVSPKETTFCFVTSRSLNFETRAAMIQKAKKDSPWKDVRVLDATNLEAWLEGSPSVAIWLSCKIHGVSGPFFSLDDWFENFCTSTQPNLAEGFFLKGRDASFLKNILDAWEDTQKRRVFISGESSDEALLVVAARLRTSDDPRAQQMRNNCLVVSGRNQLRDALILVKGQANGVIFAAFTPGDEDIRGASFGKVMYFINRLSLYAKNEGTIAVPQQSRSGHEDALQELGLEAETLQKVLRNSTRNFHALMRRLESSLVKMPSWAEHPHAEVLEIAMLLGGWQEDRDGDKMIIEVLSGAKYEEFQTQFSEFLSLEDAPIVRVEKQCFCTCPQDLWDCFAGKLPAALLHRFYDLLPSILSEKDPRYELPEKQWSFAEIYGKESVLEYSETLLDGITSSLVISLQYQKEIIDQSGVDVEACGRSAIRNVLGKMKDVNAMRTIAPRLPDFAEASPSAVLAYLEEGVRQPEGGDFWKLFYVSQDLVFGRHSYTHVLWALERMCWNETGIAVQAVELLFALSAKNFDYRNMGNTPLNTLCNVFRAGYRQSRFTSEEKLALLERAAAKYPAVFHELAHMILHVGQDNVSFMDKPRWRRYEEVDPSPTNNKERQEYCTRIVDIYLRNMRPDYDSWKAILKAPNWFMDRIEDVCAVGTEQVSFFAPEDRVQIAEELAALISHHRRFQGAGWALPEKFLVRLEALYEAIKPDGVIAYQVYLRGDFEGLHPTVWEEGKRDYHVRKAAMQKMRTDALQKAVRDFGRPAALSLNFDGASWDIGHAIADGVLEGEFDWAFLEPLHEKNKLIGSRTIDALYFRNGMDKMRESMQVQGIAGERAGRLWAAVYVDFAILDFIEKEASDEEKKAFWDNVQDTQSEMDEAHFRLMLERLLVHDRPYSIIGMFWHCDLNVPELWIRTLRAARSKYPDPEKNGFQFSFIVSHIEGLLEKLYRYLDTYHAEISALEFAYLPLLGDAPCSGLQYEIAHSPKFFHEMLCAAYIPDDGQKKTLSEEEKRIATLCSKYFWNHREIPGMSEQGVDSPVFRDWLSQAGELARSSGHARAFDIEIGGRLACAPADANGGWPHKEVCEYLEAGSECLRRHFEIGCYNKRGAYWVNAGETDQALAEQYAKWAERIEFSYPRIGDCLRNLAKGLKESSHAERKKDYYGV